MEDDYGLGWAQDMYDRQEPPLGKAVGTCAVAAEIFAGARQSTRAAAIGTAPTA